MFPGGVNKGNDTRYHKASGIDSIRPIIMLSYGTRAKKVESKTIYLWFSIRSSDHQVRWGTSAKQDKSKTMSLVFLMYGLVRDKQESY